MILPFLLILLGTSCLAANESSELPLAVVEEGKLTTIFRKLSEDTFYHYVGTALETASLMARFGWGLSCLSPWVSTVGKECLFFSRLFDTAAKHISAQKSKGSSGFKEIPFSQMSWQHNKMVLSQIPVRSREDQQLLHFLEKRWLAKSTGFFSPMINWVCPCFGISLQVHPETTGCSYARSPSIKLSQTYINRVENWKRSLPHPQEFPLILTRPFEIQSYLPSCLQVARNETIQNVIERITLRPKSKSMIVDLTKVFPDNDRKAWLTAWTDYRDQFVNICKERQLKLGEIICIQRCQQGAIGGIRLLPLSSEDANQQHEFLLGWISNFGISANLIELDRWDSLPSRPLLERAMFKSPSKEEFISFLNGFGWKSHHPQKNLMVTGTLQVLKALFGKISQEKWNEIIHCPTRSSVVGLCFSRIQHQLKLLDKEKGSTSFFDTAGHIELIHANITSLLEIFKPFSFADFSSIYQDLLTSIPSSLKPLTSYGVHSSGMTSVAGIFKAVEKSLGKPPRVFYGENTYFECVNAAHLVSEATSIEEAKEEDWKEVDLILSQFNPVLRKVDYQIASYSAEKVAEILHKALQARKGKPLTLALDCTLDFIDSPRVGSLLTEFQEEIKRGGLNIICYRSGLKFDLFGMDNYCGAPFYMIHAENSGWDAFDALLTDPALLSDHLSLNWFCLAYQSAAPQLELYRKQIFDNTRAFLSKVPPRLFNKNSPYRIVPVEEGADPAFVDIRISGPLHHLRGSALLAGWLTIKCMEGGHPIFYRPSLGLYHPNLTMIFTEEMTTMRLTLGLDPAQIDLLADCFEAVDTLNDSLLLTQK